MGRAGRAAALLCLAALTASTARAEERPWVEVRSPRFTIVSQAGEKSARDLAWQFEQVHSVFSRAYPWAKLESGRPFVVIAVRNEEGLRALAPLAFKDVATHLAAVFTRGPSRDIVAMRTDVGAPTPHDENPYSVAYQGYVSLILTSSFSGRLPFWLSDGLQMFFGNTVVRDEDVHVGRLISSYLERLHSTARLPLAQVMSMDRDSPLVQGESGRRLFDAESWLLVHYLFFGENGTLQPKLNQFAGMLKAGKDPKDSWQAVFGDLKPIEDGLNDYVTRRLYHYTKLNLDVNVDRASFSSRPVSPAQATALNASLQVGMNGPSSAARATAEAAVQLDPNEPLAYEAVGVVADRESRDDDGRVAFGRAADLGSQNAYVHYRYARLLWNPGIDRPTLNRMATALARSIEINPDYSWAYALLAQVRVRLEAATDALQPARMAALLAPAESAHRRTLAEVLGHLGRLDEATAEAGRSLALALTDEQKKSARETLAWLANKRIAASAQAEAQAQPRPETTSATAAGSLSVTQGPTPAVVSSDRHPCDLDDPKFCAAWLVDADKACGAGTLEACSSLGWAYTGARTLKRDPAKAVPPLEKACAGGIQPACHNLAVVFANRQTPEGLQRAIDLTTKACATGLKDACDLKAQLRARLR